jgi:hypothetical protein
MSKARDLANAGTALTTVSATELGYLDGVTSAVQTQLNAKQATVSGVNDTEIGYLDGVTSAIQTQLDARVPNSTITTKGDLIVGTGSGTYVRQGVGSNGQLLAANSAQADGVEWVNPPSSGGMTLLGSGTLANATVDITGISSEYNQILINVGNAVANTSTHIRFRINDITTNSSYNTYGHYTGSTSVQNNPSTGWDFGGAYIISSSSNNRQSCSLLLTNPNATNANKLGWFSGFGGDTNIFSVTSCVQTTSHNTAITKFSIMTGSGYFTGGSYSVWGIK